MKGNHLTHCLVGVAVAVGVLMVFGVQAGTLVYVAAVLACPLMMIFMMRGMSGGHGQGHGGCDHPDHQPDHQPHQHIGGKDTNEPTERTR